jgi:hypothetical protein
VDHVVPHYDEDSANPRLQLKTDTVREEYSKLYDEQLRNIIEGYDVFHGDEDPIAFNSSTTGKTKGRPQNKNMSSAPPVLKGHVEGLFPRYSSSAQYQNWKAKQTVLKGGANYQHPHSDNAIVNSYANLEVFPFVCIHGFGVDEFSMWLLPNPLQRHYGFEHKFGAKNMLLMRGDFVHAGCPGTNPRAHLEFFPREGAGWTRQKSFWNMKAQKIHPTFLWQKPTYPFGYPYATDPDQNGDVTITYPPRLTRFLRLPMSKKKCKRENIPFTRESSQTKKMRRELCATINSQSW